MQTKTRTLRDVITNGVSMPYFTKPGIEITTASVPTLSTAPEVICDEIIQKIRNLANSAQPIVNAIAVTATPTTVDVIGPLTSDLGQYEALLAIELTFQLNMQSIPTSPFDLTFAFNGLSGSAIANRSFNIKGTANIVNNDAAPSILFLPFLRQTITAPAGTGAGYADNPTPSSAYRYDAPIFNYLSATQQPTPTPANLALLFPNWVTDFTITAPANALTAGLTLTIRPIITGSDHFVTNLLDIVRNQLDS
jgi:hypothetical protein